MNHPGKMAWSLPHPSRRHCGPLPYRSPASRYYSSPQDEFDQVFSHVPQDTVGFVFEPTDTERRNKKLEVKYSPRMDKYVRSVENHQGTRAFTRDIVYPMYQSLHPVHRYDEIPGWRTLVYDEQNIQRKVENDWHKAYLARRPGTATSRIEWRFDLSRMGQVQRVKHLNVHFSTRMFSDGQVRAYVAADNGATVRLAESNRSQEVKEVRGCQRFSIIAELTRGQGAYSWQHAQLFRQDLQPGFFSSDDAQYPFRVSVHME